MSGVPILASALVLLTTCAAPITPSNPRLIGYHTAEIDNETGADVAEGLRLVERAAHGRVLFFNGDELLIHAVATREAADCKAKGRHADDWVGLECEAKRTLVLLNPSSWGSGTRRKVTAHEAMHYLGVDHSVEEGSCMREVMGPCLDPSGELPEVDRRALANALQ